MIISTVIKEAIGKKNSFFTDDNFIPNNVIYKQKDNVNDAIYRIMSVNNDSSPFL